VSLSVRAYARVRGVSHVAVLKAIKTRRISQNDDGTIDPEKANREWDQNTFAGKTMTAPPGHRGQDAGQSDTGGGWRHGHALPEGEGQGAGLQGADAELEFNLRSGKLIEATTAGEYASSVSKIIRDQVSAWPDRLTPMLRRPLTRL